MEKVTAQVIEIKKETPESVVKGVSKTKNFEQLYFSLPSNETLPKVGIFLLEKKI
jgi:hypothetical protein